VYALKRAALLIRELAGGKISSEIVDIYSKPVEPLKINVTWKNVNRLAGKEIGHELIKSILTDLGISTLNETAEGILVSVPTFKTDVTREADIIEEILRIYGYDYIEMPGQVRSSLSFSNKPDPEKTRNLVSDFLSGNGFVEVMNNSLTRSKYAEESPWLNPAHSVLLLNPLSSDLNVMRQTLLFGGLETISYNQNRKTFDLSLYEFGRTYKFNADQKVAGDNLSGYDEHEHLALWITGRQKPESWRNGDDKSDFYSLKVMVHDILSRLGFKADKLTKTSVSDELFEEALAYAYGPSEFVRFGMIRKKVLKRFDLKQDVYYADFEWEKVMKLIAGHKVSYYEVPKFPEVRRDLALVLDNSVNYEDLEKAAFQAEKHILRSVSLFDIYQGDKIGPGKKSYAMSFLLRDDEKTLTDQVIEKTMDKILKAFIEKFNASIR